MVSLRAKKVFCVIYSGLLFVTGIILVVVSAVLTYRVFHHFDYMPGSTLGPLILLLILGIGHLFLTWLGMKGPMLEHTFHIILFIVFTVLLLLIEFTIGVWTMVLRDGAGTHAIDLLTFSFNEMITRQYYDENFAKMQTELECCGLKGPSNYVAFQEGNVRLSYMSCKDLRIPNNNVNFEPYNDGCENAISDYVQLLLLEAAIMSFLATIFHGLGLYVVISFYKTLKQERIKRAERITELQRQLSGQSQQSQSLLQTPPQTGAVPPPHGGMMTPPPQIGMVPPPVGMSVMSTSPPASPESGEPVRPPREKASAPLPPTSAPPPSA